MLGTDIYNLLSISVMLGIFIFKFIIKNCLIVHILYYLTVVAVLYLITIVRIYSLKYLYIMSETPKNKGFNTSIGKSSPARGNNK